MSFKIIHIHNDIKFIDETGFFENPAFDNEVVILGKKGNYKGRYETSATYLDLSRTNMKSFVEHCNDADMVVLYNLCLKKSLIANQLAAHVKIAWRFFGHELYRYHLDELQSELTNEMLKPDRHGLSAGLMRFKNSLYQLRSFLKLRTTYNYEFTKAMNRVNFFLWFYREEYECLKNRWPNLPELINLPFVNKNFRQNNLQDKQNLIIVGNSKNSLNNHFDILDILVSSKNFYKYDIAIPFSYGKETIYSSRLRKKVKGCKNITLSETFIPLDDYELMFDNASAMVINSFRQRALGNILLALHKGVKVYLNTKNILYSILLSRGLQIYSVDQLFDDLEKQNVRSSAEVAERNSETMRKLSEFNSVALFQQRVHDFLKDRRKVK